ncbi:MAG: hypothetical protein M1269_02425 [Chloroflexi bacterium]|nr:hypothetical protein [Chloroflexota bacterium]
MLLADNSEEPLFSSRPGPRIQAVYSALNFCPAIRAGNIILANHQEAGKEKIDSSPLSGNLNCAVELQSQICISAKRIPLVKGVRGLSRKENLIVKGTAHAKKIKQLFNFGPINYFFSITTRV